MLEQFPKSELLCNSCGLVFAQLGGVSRTEISPEARHQLAAGNKSPLARWIRKRA
jgi:rubredoxin